MICSLVQQTTEATALLAVRTAIDTSALVDRHPNQLSGMAQEALLANDES